MTQNNINGGDRPNQRQQVRCVDTERLPCRVKSELNCFEHYNRHHTTENVACQKTNAQFQEGENAVTQNNVNGGDRPNQRQQVRCEPNTFHQNCKNMSKHFFHHSRELNVHAAVKPTDDKICILSTKKSKEIHFFDQKTKIHATL